MTTAFTPALSGFFTGCLLVLAALILAALVYALTGKRFSDKLVAANLIATLVINAVLLLSVFLGQDYLIDVALLYTLLSFVATVVLSRLVTKRNRDVEQQLELLATTEPIHAPRLDPAAPPEKYTKGRNLLKFSLEAPLNEPGEEEEDAPGDNEREEP